MKKTSLAYYLHVTADKRHKILKWMGSDLAPHDTVCPTAEELPEIWLRLAKIPSKYGILGDKGFDKATRFNPRLNKVRTPWLLSNVKDYRRSTEMVSMDLETSDTRSLAEGNFSRYKTEDLLKATVPYWEIAMLPYVHEWGHANMNIMTPYRKPGKQGAVGDRYWNVD